MASVLTARRGERVVYIDTTNSFSALRAEQLFRHCQDTAVRLAATGSVLCIGGGHVAGHICYVWLENQLNTTPAVLSQTVCVHSVQHACSLAAAQPHVKSLEQVLANITVVKSHSIYAVMSNLDQLAKEITTVQVNMAITQSDNGSTCAFLRHLLFILHLGHHDQGTQTGNNSMCGVLWLCHSACMQLFVASS